MNLLEVAAKIVEREKALYPGCEDAVALKVSGGVSNQSNEFARAGTTATDTGYELPSLLIDLLQQNAAQAAPNAGLAQSSGLALSNLLNRSDLDLPYLADIISTLEMSPSSFTGSANLGAIAQRDPYSSTFEADTQGAFEQRAGTALAQSMTGPNAVRGGTNRTALAQGEMATRLGQERGTEVRAAQNQEVSQVLGANQLLSNIENARRALKLQGQQQVGAQAQGRSAQALGAAGTAEAQKGANVGLLSMVGQMLGRRNQTVTDNLSGTGTENRSFVQGEGGVGCCFIFLQALNGTLPWFIDRARHDFYSPQRRTGYKWMSRWLVPQMDRRPWVSRIVNAVLIRPFLSFGGWFYGADNYRYGWLWAPYVWLWLNLWNVLGRR